MLQAVDIRRLGGALEEALGFIIREQLADETLWNQVADVFGTDVDASDLCWRGEFWGKLARGAALVVRCTGDREVYELLTRSVRRLLSHQDDEGRLSTYDKAREFQGWDLWGRKYVMVGLQYYLDVCRDEALAERVKAALIRHSDYIVDHIGPKSEGKIPITTTSTHWDGVNSSSILKAFVVMYRLTGRQRYLDFARNILEEGGMEHFHLFRAAYENRLAPYEYPVTKAYETISCFEGALELYKVTGEEKLLDMCVRFADAVLATDVTIVGGTGCYDELFDHSRLLQVRPSAAHMQETCVTVSMMLYLFELIRITGRAAYADAFETMLYNLYLGTLNTEKSANNLGLPFDSYSPLIAGRRALKVGGEMDITPQRKYGCCAAIGAAGAGIAARLGVLAGPGEVRAALYTPGEFALTMDGAPVRITVHTRYPEEGTVTLALDLEQPVSFRLLLRKPAWCDGCTVSVCGGAVEQPEAVGGWMTLDRVWRAGDTVELTLDMPLRRISGADFEAGCSRFAVQRGPVVFAADRRLEDPGRAFSPCCEPDGLLKGKPADADGLAVRQCVAVEETGGGRFRLIDYASAGKTWDEDSALSVWLECGRED